MMIQCELCLLVDKVKLTRFLSRLMTKSTMNCQIKRFRETWEAKAKGGKLFPSFATRGEIQARAVFLISTRKARRKWPH